MTQKDKRVLAFLIKNAAVALWLALVNGLLMNWETSLGVTRLLGETVPPALGALAVTFGAMRALRAEAYAHAAVVYDAWFTVLALAACIGALALTIRAAYARRRGQLHTTADL